MDEKMLHLLDTAVVSNDPTVVQALDRLKFAVGLVYSDVTVLPAGPLVELQREYDRLSKENKLLRGYVAETSKKNTGNDLPQPFVY